MRRIALPLAALLLLCAVPAKASPIGFTLTLGTNYNFPLISLTNTSATATITDFTLTIGNPTGGWDYIANESALPDSPPTLTPTLVCPVPEWC